MRSFFLLGLSNHILILWLVEEGRHGILVGHSRGLEGWLPSLGLMINLSLVSWEQLIDLSLPVNLGWLGLLLEQVDSRAFLLGYMGQDEKTWRYLHANGCLNNMAAISSLTKIYSCCSCCSATLLRILLALARMDPSSFG